MSTPRPKAPILTHEEERHYSDGDSIAVTYYYEGPVCPECDRIASCRKGGHEPGCQFWAPTPVRKATS